MVQVLKKTGDYISQMQNKIAKHQTEIEDLKKQNAQLEVKTNEFLLLEARLLNSRN